MKLVIIFFQEIITALQFLFKILIMPNIPEMKRQSIIRLLLFEAWEFISTCTYLMDMDLVILTILLMPPFLITLCLHSFHHLYTLFYYPLPYIQHSLVVPLYCCQLSFTRSSKTICHMYSSRRRASTVEPK